MFPRSERFIDITPGPNHYDVKNGEDDPYKRFGFLGKTKRFQDQHKRQQQGLINSSGGLYERTSLSASLPSLVIDDDGTDTASIHSNGSTTPDYTRRPYPAVRSKSSDKLGLTSSKMEEKLKRELAELTEKFEKYRISHQKDLDVMAEKQKRGETMYQGAIKDKNAIMTQLASKESEIAELGVRHNILRASLEKSEKAAAAVNDKIGKAVQLQKRIDELEKLLNRTKLSLEEQQASTSSQREKLTKENQQLTQRLSQQKEVSDQALAQVQEDQRLERERYDADVRRAKDDSDYWKRKYEELERRVRELEEELERERRLVEELRAKMRQEREQLQAQIDIAEEKVQTLENNQRELKAVTKETTDRLQREKKQLDEQLQASRMEFEQLEEKHQATERDLEEQTAQYAKTVEAMELQHQEHQARLVKERQDHSKARHELEQSITHLISELGQNRDALLRVQRERATLQDKYDDSQLEIQAIAGAMKTLEEQHQELKETSQRTREEWIAKYKDLSEETAQQKKASDSQIAELKTTLEKKQEEYSKVMKSIESVQAELKTVESEREEANAQRLEEERQSREKQERLEALEQENQLATVQLTEMSESNCMMKQECDRLIDLSETHEKAIVDLKAEFERASTENKELEAQQQKRIQELEDVSLAAAKQAEVFHRNEEVWESERSKLKEDTTGQKATIESLEARLDKITMEKDTEAKASAQSIQALEARCQLMEAAFKELFNKSGSVQDIDEADNATAWKQHSEAILKVLLYHTTDCSISKTEHAALLEEKTSLENSSLALSTLLSDQEAFVNKAQADHSGLLAKIAELEDQILRLNMQVEFLEAENIGKVAIIKALQDEYEYQERVIRDLSKHDDAVKEVARLEEELRTLTNHTRDTDVWIKQVQADVEKYREAYVKADVAREETLLDMKKLHEELAESEAARLQVENQLQTDVSVLIKKHALSNDELSRLSKMNVDSAQNLSLKQKVKQLAQLKEENLALKKKNLALSNTRDTLRLKYLQTERDLEAYKAAAAATAAAGTPGSSSPTHPPGSNGPITTTLYRQSTASSVSGSSIISSSTSSAGDVSPNGKLQLQALTAAVSAVAVSSVPTSVASLASPRMRPRSTSTVSVRSANGGGSSSKLVSSTASSTTGGSGGSGGANSNKGPVRSRAARSFMAGHGSTGSS
ncbi:hypothetical protein BGZ97_011156 [Linnemannia gamsii]|uniref:Hyaluronan-mediated motility receptor C-terminal domain-containing protein n=1 Tax=Linnemannia gamsii TaxID=64522 RepID=A0A9P6UM61_9FUNG|nr:hypothetical protein BGZ97_011156 [Linnemannia gamsii]